MSNQIDVQEQPHDRDTERSILSTLMRYNERFSANSDLLSADLFYYDHEKNIYRAIEGVITGGGITDVNSLYEYSRRNRLGLERSDFLEIIQYLNIQTLEQDIRRLRRMSKQRLCWLIFQKAAQKVVDPMSDIDEEVNEVMSSLNELQSESDDGICSFGDALQELEDIVKDNADGRRIYLQTGFRIFDDYFLLRPSTMTVIAAFTSVGKSALAMNITMNIAKQGIGVAYYSLEMGKAELASRVISKQMKIPASILMNKPLAEFQRSDFGYVLKGNENLPIYIDERSTVSFDRTIRSIRTMVKTRNVKLAVIDYLQIYTQVSENIESSLAYMARAAKNIAKELGIAVILLSQLNRSGVHPTIKMLRGSGQIEESADNIVLIDRPEAYPDNKIKYEGEFENEPTAGTAKLMLVKGRGVGTGCRLVGFEGQYTQFYERDTDNQIGNDAPF